RSRRVRAPTPCVREKVGMRGRCGLADFAAKICNAVAPIAPLSIAERPPHPPSLPPLDLPPPSGGGGIPTPDTNRLGLPGRSCARVLRTTTTPKIDSLPAIKEGSGAPIRRPHIPTPPQVASSCLKGLTFLVLCPPRAASTILRLHRLELG